MSIESMNTDEVMQRIEILAKLCRENQNLEILFGNNGMSGRSATGNFTLLARATSLSRVHVGKVLKGLVEPSHQTLVKISQATGISIDQISEYIREKRAKKNGQKVESVDSRE